MKIVRAYLLKWYFSVPLCLSFLAMSCQSKSEEEAMQPSIATYDGIEIFKGLMFSRGEVAEMFPELKREVRARATLSGEIRDDLIKMEDDVAKIINAKNPEYFADFKSSIISGNHLTIQQELLEAQEVVVKTIYEMSGLKAPNISSLRELADVASEQYDIDEIIAEDGTVNLEKLEEISKENSAINSREACLVVLVVAVALAFWVWVVEVQAFDYESESSLRTEQLIQSIANKPI